MVHYRPRHWCSQRRNGLHLSVIPCGKIAHSITTAKQRCRHCSNNTELSGVLEGDTDECTTSSTDKYVIYIYILECDQFLL